MCPSNIECESLMNINFINMNNPFTSSCCHEINFPNSSDQKNAICFMFALHNCSFIGRINRIRSDLSTYKSPVVNVHGKRLLTNFESWRTNFFTIFEMVPRYQFDDRNSLENFIFRNEREIRNTFQCTKHTKQFLLLFITDFMITDNDRVYYSLQILM